MEYLRSIFRSYYANGEFCKYSIFKYEPKDHDDPRCIVAGVPLEDALRYRTKLLDK